ncbi:hypothetical protein LXA43DRAFT_1062147 [Ganoderma leucocontextum]|nr:hypothetical protein LXA43DRAFT_1062147 [Ganoderma leucocontextum]
MSIPRPRPRRANANHSPAAVVLAAKQTRRPSAVVAQEKAALEAQRQALIQKREADLEQLRQLDLQLQSTSATRSVGHVPAPDADTSAPVVASGQASTGRKVQPGRTRRITRADVEDHRMGAAVPAGQDSDAAGGDGEAAKENAVPAQAATDVNKKRKAEGGGETSMPKKGKPSKPSGPTASAAATFSTPASKKPTKQGARSQAIPPALPLPTASSTAALTVVPTISATHFQAHGVYTQALDLDDFEDNSTALVERPAATIHGAGTLQNPAALAKKSNVIHLEVVDVTAEGPTTEVQTTGANQLLPVAPTIQALQPAPAAPAPGLIPQPRGGQWAMHHLEPILGPYLGNFTHYFIPKLINLTGNLGNGPWRLHGLDLKGAMESLAAEVWPMQTIIVIPRQPFFELAKQKLWEYRNGMANHAFEVVTTYMLSKRFETAEERVEYVKWALSEKDSWPFRYARVEEAEDHTIKGYGAYQGTLVSRAFAYHLKRINIPADRIRDHPCNALALSTVAVERALKMWSTGALLRPRGRSEEAKFSERLWGKPANEYMGSIMDLTDEQWDKILAKAELCARGFDEDSDDDFDDESERPEDLPTTGRAVLMDAELEEQEHEG